jgi:hypothetical protein
LGYQELMQQCWTDKPFERPGFNAVVRMLDARLVILDKRDSFSSSSTSNAETVL